MKNCFLALMLLCVLATSLFAQQPSNINLNSTDRAVADSVWSPAGNYARNMGITGNNWNMDTHHNVRVDYYAVDINAGYYNSKGEWVKKDDQWMPVYLPISGRVWTAHPGSAGYNYGYGNTAQIWEESTGKVARLAHMVAFAKGVRDWKAGEWHHAGELIGYVGGTPNWGPHLHLALYRDVFVGDSGNSLRAVEADLAAGTTPKSANPQKYRIVGTQGELLQFTDTGSAVYQRAVYDPTHLRPVSVEVLMSLGCLLDLYPVDATKERYDESLSPINKPGKTIAEFTSGEGITVSDKFALPRAGAVIKGKSSAGVYMYNSWFKNLLSGVDFPTSGGIPGVSSDAFADKAHAWEEVTEMPQDFLDGMDDVNSKVYVSSGKTVSGYLTPYSRTSANKADYYTDVYYLDVKKGDYLQVNVSSSDFNPWLDIYNDETGALLWSYSSRTSGGKASITQQAVDFSARLRIEVSGYGTRVVGAYTIDYNGNSASKTTDPDPGSNPLDPTVIHVGQAIAGSLSTTDAKSFIVNPGCYADNYSIDLIKDQTITVAITSSSIPSGQYIYLLDANSKALGGFVGGAGVYSYFTVPSSGTYRIHFAGGAVGETGDYVIDINNGQGVTPTIHVGEVRSSALATASSLSYVRGTSGNRYFADNYRLDLVKDQIVTVDLVSPGLLGGTKFDAYLYLLGSNGDILATDDNGGGNKNSRFTFKATFTGTFRLHVTSSLPSEVGNYSLLVTNVYSPPPPQ